MPKEVKSDLVPTGGAQDNTSGVVSNVSATGSGVVGSGGPGAIADPYAMNASAESSIVKKVIVGRENHASLMEIALSARSQLDFVRQSTLSPMTLICQHVGR